MEPVLYLYALVKSGEHCFVSNKLIKKQERRIRVGKNVASQNKRRSNLNLEMLIILNVHRLMCFPNIAILVIPKIFCNYSFFT